MCDGFKIPHVPPSDYIDLSPLMADLAASAVLLLVRGQLNRVFRACGLLLPDSMPLDGLPGSDPADSDDPAAKGIDLALARFQEPFLIWSSRMPVALVQPVLAILRQTHQALENQQAGAVGKDAVMTAYNFLLGLDELG